MLDHQYHLGRDDDKGKSARHLKKETQVNEMMNHH